jgi:hypothetical protein
LAHYSAHEVGLRRSVFSFVILLAAFAPTAVAGVPTPLSPANGASVRVTPPKGFANGDIPFRWSITYPDCPGPASIHSSYVEFRRAGQGDFQPTQRGGPFLGDGTFTTPGNVFVPKTATRYEWRVFWACGATEDFAGSQGRSTVLTFTVLPPAARQPSCASLADKQRTRCLARKRHDAELARCAKLASAKRATCVANARAAFRRATR